ncbi:hypothetical protein X777_05902 [Ooceraea biroi]|uniref:Uncharacterized protein n=1 Tax=Ooceraea biroi TaxID=2015173 RepID=A0A026WDL1_OOCBI|nr:hypothetical protein X777_05902 [Ooceraea biroi]
MRCNAMRRDATRHASRCIAVVSNWLDKATRVAHRLLIIRYQEALRGDARRTNGVDSR